MRAKRSFNAKKAHVPLIHWKSVDLLRNYMTRFGAIKPRKYTGSSVKEQKAVRKAIIRGRELGLLPYTK